MSAGVAALALALLVSGASAQSTGGDSWPDLKRIFFQDRSIVDDPAILSLDAPPRAEDAALVPMTLSVHVPPGDTRSSVDWAALAKTEGTLVLLMALERISAVAETLIGNGCPGSTPVSVIADGTMPTQRTIYSTLERVSRQVADEGIRPPAVVVIGGVITIAAELARLARDLTGPGGAPSLVPPLAEDN